MEIIRKLLTTAAARFCTVNGRPVSHRTLQKYRARAPNDPGERGPNFLRDPATGYSYYREDDLLAWCRELDARLVERGAIAQSPALARDAA